MVEVAAIMAQAASTALPPCSKILAPAVAARGLPVTAIQWRPCSGRLLRAPLRLRSAENDAGTHHGGDRPRTNPPGPQGRRSSFPFWPACAFPCTWRERAYGRLHPGARGNGRAPLPRALGRDMTTATITQLFVYPREVHARHCARAGCASLRTGLEWDRQWMVVDATGTFLSQRTHPQPGAHRARDRQRRAGTERSRACLACRSR